MSPEIHHWLHNILALASLDTPKLAAKTKATADRRAIFKAPFRLTSPHSRLWTVLEVLSAGSEISIRTLEATDLCHE